MNAKVDIISIELISIFREKTNWNSKQLLSLERTIWKLGITNINVLMAGVCYKGIRISLLWKMLKKKKLFQTKKEEGIYPDKNINANMKKLWTKTKYLH